MLQNQGPTFQPGVLKGPLTLLMMFSVNVLRGQICSRMHQLNHVEVVLI